jgi:hypothetical protein
MPGPAAHPIEGNPGHKDQVQLLDGDLLVGNASQLSPWLENPIHPHFEFVHRFEVKEFQFTINTVGDYDSLSTGQRVRQTMASPHFIAHIDVVHHRVRRDVLGKALDAGEDLLTDWVLVRLGPPSLVSQFSNRLFQLMEVGRWVARSPGRHDLDYSSYRPDARAALDPARSGSFENRQSASASKRRPKLA